MAKVTYKDGATSQYGYEFEAGKAVEVTDPKHLAKFAGNAFFDVASDEPAPATDPKPPFVAKEKSKGWWAITDADGNEIGKSIREADATAFNAMSDEDKAEYLK